MNLLTLPKQSLKIPTLCITFFTSMRKTTLARVNSKYRVYQKNDEFWERALCWKIIRDERTIQCQSEENKTVFFHIVIGMMHVSLQYKYNNNLLIK